MILYLDASALVKRYTAETGSMEVELVVSQADVTATSIVCRAEVSAALAKAARMGALSLNEAEMAMRVFRSHWMRLPHIALTEAIVARADEQAWEHGLRGYDAVHLATALFWQETMGERVTLATFDRQLWRAGHAAGMAVWPSDLDGSLVAPCPP